MNSLASPVDNPEQLSHTTESTTSSNNDIITTPDPATTPDNDPAPYFTEAAHWDASRITSLERGERRAWICALILGSGFLLSTLALLVLMPLKQSIPYVIRVDSATGVPDIVTAMDDHTITGDEVMDKYWLARYVRHRESYDWHTLQNDYDTVGLMSSTSTGRDYASQFEGEHALQDINKDRIRERIHIISVVPANSRTGTVRFIKTRDNLTTGTTESTTRWVATIGFDYLATARMKASDRLINPFGFQVTSYRIDPEINLEDHP